MERPLLTFDKIRIGEVYAERRWTITEEIAATYARLTQALPRAAVAPTLLAMWTPPRICFDRWAIPPGGIHVAQSWRTSGPIRVGDVLNHRVVATHTFRRKERPHAVFTSSFFNHDGRCVAEGRMTVLWPA